MRPERPEMEAQAADHDRAFEELSFLLSMFTRTVSDMVGRATPAVGQMAGRQAARKMPLYFEEVSHDRVLEAIHERFGAAFEISTVERNDGVMMSFGHCALRAICHMRQENLGGSLCTLFHTYIAGMTGELLHHSVTTTIEQVGQTCLIRQRLV